MSPLSNHDQTNFVFLPNSVLFKPLPRHFGFVYINDGGDYIIRNLTL